MSSKTAVSLGRGASVLAFVLSAATLSACSPVSNVGTKPTRSKEYFAESEYGVKASPRVSNARSGLPRGGGRDQVGKPYKVRGKWYHPKEDPSYRNSGLASWYGDAFHGRLTANGEIYDMTHLTAAHPTMPLPSYARVTNRANGASVIVRVNDRGPFAEGRVIDLSRKAAELLDYTSNGLAKVDVEYVGRAPLHGQDDRYLLASYKPAGKAPDPSDGMASGVMIAMNGPTPTPSLAAARIFPGQSGAGPLGSTSHDVVLPEFGPIAPQRPGVSLASLETDGASSITALGYADDRVNRAAQIVSDFAEGSRDSSRLIEALNQRYAATASTARTSPEYVAVGTYPDQLSAETMARALTSVGQVVIETDPNSSGFSLRLNPNGRAEVDEMLRTAWAAGATDAMTVRD
ncbi:rare lipoprotein A [Aquamicrobium aerolatum DSM 21857]|uniref:Endolytic peptidoglycan transglycosylase RlpA n=1 Tax=Aquamicrobium aerolatum DSM 21857 TaxID=1121003 RepID=A0A1I3P988_9HYPH|nr:septal ring lytic transglycosylase RlpA family protein [Aquamicrobium aerolatum]SFJ18118.1 rare lipoprotein A [Aquamicrobium aerolatum DSM 21857]